MINHEKTVKAMQRLRIACQNPCINIYDRLLMFDDLLVLIDTIQEYSREEEFSKSQNIQSSEEVLRELRNIVGLKDGDSIIDTVRVLKLKADNTA